MPPTEGASSVTITPQSVPAPFPGKAKVIPGPGFLLPFQARWVNDPSRLKLAVKSRQIGWTWATALALLVRKAADDARLDAWISAQNENQARLFLDDCRTFARALNLRARDLGRVVIDEQGHCAQALRLANGRRIHGLSSNPDAHAGKRGDLVLDEFALHPDPCRLYSIALPAITWGGRLEVFSTPRGTDNYFHKLVREITEGGNPKGFSFHQATLQDALEQGLLYKLQQKLPVDDPRQEMNEDAYYDFIRRSCPDEETFQQEYMCVPAHDQSAFLSCDLIASCEYPLNETWRWHPATASRSECRHALYLGIDIGRDHDLTVFWLVEKIDDVFYTRHVQALSVESFEAQESVLKEFLNVPQLRRCCIDQTGLGRQFAERAARQFGNYKVEGITFSPAVKEELAYPVRTAFEARKVRIPPDPLIRSDLRALKKETTASGHIRFTADRGRNGHADRFWALALALHAGRECCGMGAMVGRGYDE